MLEGSKMDWAYKVIKPENYPLIKGLITAIRARPEFKGVLANKKPFAEQTNRYMDMPPGERAML